MKRQSIGLPFFITVVSAEPKKSSPLARATEFEKKMQKWQSDLRDTPLDNSPTSSSSSEKHMANMIKYLIL
jgi:hypothetical protein